MIALTCPECPDTEGGVLLERGEDRTVWCPRCFQQFVVSMSRAGLSGHVNRDAPFYNLVIEVDRIFAARQKGRERRTRLLRAV